MAGPTIPETLNCKPPSITAEGNSSLLTTSGTTELQAGALKAKPTPIVKTEIRITYGLSNPKKPRSARQPADPANHKFIAQRSFFRSTMSARAPAGSVKKKKGSAATVDITEIRNIDGVSVFITQVAAVSWAETHTPETRL